jgi:hypothetical protein
VLPAPVIGPPEEELDPPESLLEPQPAAAKATSPQANMASVDLREITFVRLLFGLGHPAASQWPSSALLPPRGRLVKNP